MATTLWRKLGEQILDSNGDPLAGGKIRYDRATTTTLLTTYSDAAGTVPNTQTDNRIILDSAGRLEEPIYIDDSFDVKETVYTSADVIVDPWPFDNIPKAVDLTASLSDFAKPRIQWATDTDSTVNLTSGNLGSGRIASTGSNSITYAPISASAAGNGNGYLVKKTSGSNTVTFDPDGSETVDGAASFSWTEDDVAYWFISDGANWQVSTAYLTDSALGGIVPGILAIQSFTSSGTYTPTSGMTKALVFCTGGGGGGGGADSTGTSSSGGGGGGSGGTAIELLTAATIGASQSVTIGAGGTAGAAANGGSGGNVTQQISQPLYESSLQSV